MSIPEEYQSLDLYAVLGVSRDADPLLLRRSYLNKAREVHPDKGGDAEQFRRVAFAYSVLSDESRRHYYDTVGSVSPEVDAKIADLFSRSARTEISADIIEEDRAAYQGSDDELKDLRRLYRKHDGDFDYIFQAIPHSTIDDQERLVAAILAAIDEGDLESTPQFRRSTTKAAMRKRATVAQREAAQAAKAKAEIGVETDSQLAELIRSRNKSRHEGLLAALEAKYGAKSSVSKRPTVGKNAR